MADGQGSVRSSSLLQGISRTYRGSVELEPGKKNEEHSNGQRLAEIAETHGRDIAKGHAGLQGKSNMGQHLQNATVATTHADDNSTSSELQAGVRITNKQGDNITSTSKQVVQHRLMSLLQQKTGSLGAAMFITGILFLIAVVLMVSLAVLPTETDSSPTYQRSTNPSQNMNQSQKGVEKIVLNHPPSSAQGLPMQAESSQYAINSTNQLDRHSSTPQSSTRPSAPTVTTGDIKKKPLSPQLVVPDDCECALVLQMPSSGWRGSFSVCDCRGSAVLQVLIEEVNTQGEKGVEIQLCSSSVPTSTVARCRLLNAGNKKFYVYQKDSSELFATVTSEGVGKARLLLAAGGHFDFIREDQENVRVLDEHDQLHGTSESYKPPAGSAVTGIGADDGNLCLVRVGPLSDAGLVLCGLMCVHQLNLATGKRSISYM